MSRAHVRAGFAATLLVAAVAGCAVPPPTPEAVARVRAEAKQALLPGAPQPGDYGYDPNPCAGDSGMLAEMTQDIRGRIRLGPPQMSLCP